MIGCRGPTASCLLETRSKRDADPRTFTNSSVVFVGVLVVILEEHGIDDVGVRRQGFALQIERLQGVQRGPTIPLDSDPLRKL